MVGCPWQLSAAFGIAACPAAVNQDVGLDILLGSFGVHNIIALWRPCCLLLDRGFAPGTPQEALIQLNSAYWIMYHCCGQVALHRHHCIHWRRWAAVNLGRRGKMVSLRYIPSADPNGCRGSSHGRRHHSRHFSGCKLSLTPVCAMP